jgi:subtilisin family serine protease
VLFIYLEEKLMASKKETKARTVARKRRAKSLSQSGGGTPVFPPAEAIGEGIGAETTGRFIIVFKDDVTPSAVLSTLNKEAGLREVTRSADYEGGAIDADDLAGAKVLHFDKLGVVVVSEEKAVQALAATASEADSPILAIEPEYVCHPTSFLEAAIPLDYMRGYRDAVNQLYDRLTSRGAAPGEEAEALAAFQDTSQFTWGLQATKVSSSPHSGQGIKVAVLDTGLDFQHPDFRGRAITSRSFVSGVTVQDVYGHGTHCIGTACGPQRPASGVRRYGVAFGAQIFVGKVFDNAQEPSAPTGSVIAGIEWAITNGCRVVSLSLGARIDRKIMQYEVPIRRALSAGALVVAAAGNNANRPELPGFVEPPANADAAMAVAALDSKLQIARFSARSSILTGVGGIVNISGPGVAVFSSVPVTLGGHALFNGTSMATPHVAGIAALWAQSTGLSGAALWSRLVQSARPLNVPSIDVGAGIVQAPQ